MALVLSELVNTADPWLYAAAACIIFNPTAWNIVARKEYKQKWISKRFGRENGWRMLAASIIFMGQVRTYLFVKAMEAQPVLPALDNEIVDAASWALFAIGGTFVLGSYYHLGIRHTYLGDYFGFLMDKRVTAFPFNVLDNPMYWGATIEFLSMALWAHKPAGLLLTALVYVVYQIAIQYEGSYTSMIYANKAAEDAKAKKQ